LLRKRNRVLKNLFQAGCQGESSSKLEVQN
jgi:hypothetical protein